nr:unnamed protein product [Callosobruchus chinensis]
MEPPGTSNQGEAEAEGLLSSSHYSPQG